MSNKVAEIISERFIKALEAGTVPWRKPWNTTRPFNFTSKKDYQGVNMLMLGLAGYADPRWGTYKQIAGVGGAVRKGEHGWPVVFFKMIPDKSHQPAEGERQRQIPLLRYTTAFNVEQCEGLELPPFTTESAIVGSDTVQAFIDSVGIQRKDSGRAGYSPSEDCIFIPPIGAFVSPAAYYSTYFHEMVHATGHSSRLARFENDQVDFFGSESYSKEELIAEIGASILRCEFLVETPEQFDQSAAYVAGWASKLKDEPNLILSAARQAENSTQWLMQKSESSSETLLGDFFEEVM